MKANLAQREPEMLKQWYAEDRYRMLQDATADREAFILHDGPPYANGDIHIGHAVNKVLKDMVIRSRLLSGFRAPYVPGWDCHGLPIELQVEKKVGKVGRKVDADTFRQKCREYAARQIERQREDFKRLGVLGEWENPYASSDFRFEANMLRALARIIDNGYLTQGVKPVHWCFDCGSALAEAEIEYQDKTSTAIDVLFAAVDAAKLLAIFNTPVLTGAAVGMPIWTTTPWTLPANMAVALHPELDYVLITAQQQEKSLQLVVAEALVGAVTERFGLSDVTVSVAVKGTALELLLLQHPFIQSRQVPVILGEHVTTEQGTGAVHTAPGHGQEDFDVGRKYSLEVLNPVGANGVFVEGTEYVEGQHVWKANAVIVEKLQETGSLLFHEQFEHSYPHCWRHKTPTAFRATPQWFISMDNDQQLRNRALAEIDTVEWIPDWGQARIHGMIENRPDWCISRQRTWGVPIPLFVHQETGERHPDSAQLAARVADLVEQEGIDAWFAEGIANRLGLDAEQWQPMTDILDVWFDSGVTHYCVLGDEQRTSLQRPADIYLEGSDQHRGWFQSSLLTGVAIDGKAPYKRVLTHGFVVDADGRKMSKSIGNVVAPQQIFKTLGADILRLWVASTDYTREMTVSDEILKRVADTYRRIRNTCRFLLGNLADFDPAKDSVPLDQMLPLDLWALARAEDLNRWVTENDYNNYQFHAAYQRIHNFCINEMGGFYLDVIKDRLYTMPVDHVARRSAQTVMYHSIEIMSRLLAPILCFTAEEIWQAIPGERSTTILTEQWYQRKTADDAAELSQFYRHEDDKRWQHLLVIRDHIRKQIELMRAEKIASNSLSVEGTLYASGDLLSELQAMQAELHFIFLTAPFSVAASDQAGDDAIMIDLGESGSIQFALAVTDNAKCVRCWQQVPSVGTIAEHPELCERCYSNIYDNGEQRQWG